MNGMEKLYPIASSLAKFPLLVAIAKSWRDWSNDNIIKGVVARLFYLTCVSSRFSIEHCQRFTVGEQQHPEPPSHSSLHLHRPETERRTAGRQEARSHGVGEWERHDWAGVRGWLLLWVSVMLLSQYLQRSPRLSQTAAGYSWTSAKSCNLFLINDLQAFSQQQASLLSILI